MARCNNCRRHFATMEDEADMHECPFCGWDGREDREPEDPDGEDFRGGEAAAYEREQMESYRGVK